MKIALAVTISVVWAVMGYFVGGVFFDKTKKQKLASGFIAACLAILQVVLFIFMLAFSE